jgi:hypothetical protein
MGTPIIVKTLTNIPHPDIDSHKYPDWFGTVFLQLILHLSHPAGKLGIIYNE